MDKSLQYIMHIDRYDIKCETIHNTNPNSNTWDWYNHMMILNSTQLEPINQPLKYLETKFSSSKGYDALIQNSRILYPNKSTGITVSNEINTKHFPDRRIDILKTNFLPALQTNHRYWFVRFSTNFQHQSNRVLRADPNNHGNQGYRKGFIPNKSITKQFSMSIRFEKWFPLQPPIFHGQKLPFAVTYFRKDFLSKGRIDLNIVDTEETERIQQGFRLLELPSENILTIDIDNPIEDRSYGIHWRIPSATVLNRHYPGQLGGNV